MKRTIISIDEEKCNGCGQCVTGCHEGALQLIDGKARIVSELFCDGLGACIGECPEAAIALEEREAEPYDEIAVMEKISPKGELTVEAHLKHLFEHGESGYLKEGMQYLMKNNLYPELAVRMKALIHAPKHSHATGHGHGCPGSSAMDFRNQKAVNDSAAADVPSRLTQWPVQLHLLNPVAPYFRNADVVLAADCVAFSYGNFHNDFLKGKSLAIACPKLDSNTEVYIEKLAAMIDEAEINTLTVLIMEVPCCGGLLQMAKMALSKCTRKVPLKVVVISIRGEVARSEWV